MIAIDTNLLVYAHRSAVPEHRKAQMAIEKALSSPGRCGIALPCIAEFWSVVTGAGFWSRPSTAKEANEFLRSLSESGMEVWLPGPEFDARFLQYAKEIKVSGARIFDLQIALIAREAGAREIWSHDRKFISVAGLRVVNPLTE
jgi:predicted nucleic acid-binding protein